MIQCEHFFATTYFRELRKNKKFPSIFQKFRFNIWKKKTEFMKELNLVVWIPYLYMKHRNHKHNFVNQWINSFILQGFYFPNYRKHFFARISFHKWEDNSRNLRKSPPRKFSPYKVSSVLKRKKIAGLRL